MPRLFGRIRWSSFDKRPVSKWPFLKAIILSKIASAAKNTLISPDFLVWKFCWKAQFPHSFTVPFSKISTPGNQVKLRYFSQWSALFSPAIKSCDLGIIPFESNDQKFFIFSFRTSISLLLITLLFIFNLLNLVPPIINHLKIVLTATGSPSLPVRYS